MIKELTIENTSLPEGWCSEKLDTLCDVEYGTRVVRKRDGGTIYPVYGGGGATFFMDTFNREDCLVVARFAMSEKCTRFVNGKFFLNDSGLSVKPKDTDIVSQEFLNKYFIFLNDYIYSLARGAAQKNLNVPAFRKIEILYPESLTKQKQIVAILDKAFAAIDTARANAEQNLQNAKELFESYLQKVFSTKGDDWEEKTFKELSSRIGDGLHGTPKYDVNGDYYFINGNNLNDGVIEIKENTKKINKEEFEKHKRELTNNTVLISINGTLGKVAFYDDEPVILGKSACYINFNDEVNKHYIKYLVKSPLFFKNMASNSTGATIKNFSLKSMRNYTLSLPSIKEQKKIVNKLDNISAESKKLEAIYIQKIANLEEMKKSLLQKAFSGQLNTIN